VASRIKSITGESRIVEQKERIVEIDCITHIYPDLTKVQICGLEFVVNRGERVSILGANGCGKTTLLKHLVGILVPKDGTVKVFGMDPGKHYSEIRQRIGVVMQDVDEQILGPTVFDDILFAPLNYGMPRAKAETLAKEVIERLNIGPIQGKIVHYLSGGEKKKVAIASVLTMNPDILLIDEPLASLDPKTQTFFINLLLELNQAGKTIIFTTHHLDLIDHLQPRVAVLSEAHTIQKTGPAAEILSDEKLLIDAGLLHEHIHQHGNEEHVHYHTHYVFHKHPGKI